MDKFSPVKILLLVTLLIFLVVISYVIGVGIIGGNNFSLTPKDWESFSTYFNGMLSPILAAIAAAIAFFSLTYQLNAARKETALNEQISNYIKHIDLLQGMIDKKWKAITNHTKVDWEEILFYEINREIIKSRLQGNANFTHDVIMLTRLFEDLIDAMQWYTHLHKQKIGSEAQSTQRNEWSHFSKSLIREQDKKMIFCYQYCSWIIDEHLDGNKKYHKELLMYMQLYDNLINDGTLYEQ